jgi:hypothetical protein
MVYVDDVFIPHDLGPDEQVKIIVTGNLPTPCWQDPRATVTKTKEDISVKVFSQVTKQEFCPEVLKPYTLAVNLGRLGENFYIVDVLGKNTRLTSSLNIDGKSQSPGDWDKTRELEKIANLTQVDYFKREGVVHLKGIYATDCVSIGRIDISSYEAGEYTLTPRLVKNSDFCPKVMKHFDYAYQLPESLQELGGRLQIQSSQNREFFINL